MQRLVKRICVDNAWLVYADPVKYQNLVVEVEAELVMQYVSEDLAYVLGYTRAAS